MVVTDDAKLTSIPLPTNHHIISPIKMDLPGNLIHPVALWTKEDVKKWILYCMGEYSLQDINLNDFEMNGKALLLLNEDGFKQRSPRSGDILHKALQQHNALVKSLNYQAFPYQFWGNYGLFTPHAFRHINIPLLPPAPPPLAPLSLAYMHPTVNYVVDNVEKKHQSDLINLQHSMQNRQMSNSSLSPVTKPLERNNLHLLESSIKQDCTEHNDVCIRSHDALHRTLKTSSPPSISEQPIEHRPVKFRSHVSTHMEQQSNDLVDMNENDSTKKVRYYQDRVDFHGDILMKPPAAKNCRILWEFLYILLEDPSYASIIHWENREKMIFRIVQADKLAALWGLQKNRLSMTYEKLSRGMRYYYSNNIITKEQSKRLLYRFMRSPDEIRRTMKRNVDVPSTVYSAINKRSPVSLSSTPNHIRQESSNEISNRFLQLFSIHSSPTMSMKPNLHPVNNLFFTTSNDSTSKSDRSSSSSPVSFDSNHDCETKYCSTSQSSLLTSTKRKQIGPMPLNTRPPHSFSIDQPLDLAIQKEEKIFNYKKQKFIYAPSKM